MIGKAMYGETKAMTITNAKREKHNIFQFIVDNLKELEKLNETHNLDEFDLNQLFSMLIFSIGYENAVKKVKKLCEEIYDYDFNTIRKIGIDFQNEKELGELFLKFYNNEKLLNLNFFLPEDFIVISTKEENEKSLQFFVLEKVDNLFVLKIISFKTKKDDEIVTEEKVIGKFSKIEKLEKRINNFGEVEEKKIIRIDKELDINNECFFDDFINALKPTGNFNVYNYLDFYKQFKDFIFDVLPVKKIKEAKAYGIFKKGVVLPNEYDIDLEEIPEINKFKEIFEKDVDLEKVKEVLEKYIEYLEGDELSKSSLFFGISSIFVRYLMGKNLLELAPSMIIVGKRRLGKTKRVLLNYSLPFLNLKNSENIQTFHGSGVRLGKLQYIAAPLWFDEMTKFTEAYEELIKQLSTSEISVIRRVKKNLESNNYYLIRNFIISVNSFTITDEALVDRMIIIDANKIKRKEVDKSLIKYLTENIGYFGVYFWKNINTWKEFVDEKVKDLITREEAKKRLLDLGCDIFNYILEKVGIDKKFDYVNVEVDFEDIITSKEDVFRNILVEALKDWERQHLDKNYNIADYLIEGKIDELNAKTYKDGFIIEEDFGGWAIYLTKQAIGSLKLHKFRELKINKLSDIYDIAKETTKRFPDWTIKRVAKFIFIEIEDIEDEEEREKKVVDLFEDV